MAIVSKHNERHRYRIIRKIPGLINLIEAERIDPEGEHFGVRDYNITSFRATNEESQAIMDVFGKNGQEE